MLVFRDMSFRPLFLFIEGIADDLRDAFGGGVKDLPRLYKVGPYDIVGNGVIGPYK